MARYHIIGTYSWDEIKRYTRSQHINTVVEADSEDDAIDLALEDTNIDYWGEVDDYRTNGLVANLLPELTPEELEFEERRQNEYMMQVLGMPTLFEIST